MKFINSKCLFSVSLYIYMNMYHSIFRFFNEIWTIINLKVYCDLCVT